MTSEDGVQKLREQAAKVKLEAERLEAELNLEKIANLEKKLQASRKMNDDDEKIKSFRGIKEEVRTLATRVDPSLLSSFQFDKIDDTIASNSAVESVVDDNQKVETQTNLYANRKKNKIVITESELMDAIEYYNSLPMQMRRALASAIDLDEATTSPAIVVLGLYELGDTLTENKLQTLYKEAKTKKIDSKNVASVVVKGNDGITEGEVDNPFNPWSKPTAENQVDVNNMVESVFPRVMMKDDISPTSIDVEVLTSKGIFGKDTFQASGPPERISGGFIVRGSMAPKLKNDGDRLIELLDSTIDSVAPAWNDKFQVSYMTDPTPQMLDDSENLNGEAVLVIHSRDMKPTTSTLFSSGVSAISLFFAFVFAISTFGQNDLVMQRLTAANNANDYDLTWFNELITPLLVSVGVSQLFHEVGHLFVAKKEGFKITPPTVLPSVALPFLSFQNRIKTSPKNLNQLFNFASAGPALGLISSFTFLMVGLQLTLTMDASQLQNAPSVPVGFLNLSSLGGNIVDYVLSGGTGDGIILKQDPNTPIQLHPYAIGGFAGMMINSLDLIPIAGTDGGRMSHALLGRPGHLAFSSIIYGGLVLYTIFSGHTDIILGYLFVNSFTQKDLEIPSRNEVDNAGLGQATIALILWCIAILTLVPAN